MPRLAPMMLAAAVLTVLVAGAVAAEPPAEYTACLNEDFAEPHTKYADFVAGKPARWVARTGKWC